MTFPVLIPRFTYGDLDLTDVPFAVNQEGIDFQSGDLVVSVLSSFLQDGELEVSSGRGNMTLVIPVLIEGSDLLALAEAEALLAIEAQKPTNTFTIDPGDDIAPATVFDTFQAADVAYTYNAAAEQQGFRQFNLTISALPFGGSDFIVTAEAVVLDSSTPTTVVINDGSSTAGWSSSTSSVVTSGTAVKATGFAGSSLKLTQAFSATGTRWIFADWTDPAEYEPGAGGITLVITTASGDTTAAIPYRTDPQTSGFSRSYWQIPTGVSDAVTALSFEVGQSGFGTLSIDQVARTSAPPTLGTNRQQARVAPVAGSARTQAGIQVSSPTSSLGEVLVYTSNTGIAPALGPLRTSAVPTLDAARVSGGYFTLSTPAIFDVPLASLTPGLHALIALSNSPGGGARTLTWISKTRINSTDVGRTLTGTAAVSATSYGFVPLGLLNLPTNGVRATTTGVQRIQVSDAGGGTAARLDELYICNLSTGRLSIVSCGTGTAAAGGPSSNLWLDPATVATRTASIMRGFAADGSDAFFAGDSIQAAGQHEFIPTSAKIFVVTTNATDAAVTLTHRPRWLGHAALVAP